MKQNYIGIIEDTRPAEQKAKDFKHSELVSSSVPVKWTADNFIPNYLTRNQGMSGSCGAQSGAKAFTIMYGNVYSAIPFWLFRSNFPSTGMSMFDIAEAGRKKGTVLESVLPSQLMSDEQMNSAVEAEFRNKFASGYVFLDDLDIDVIASVLDANKHVLIAFRSSWEEFIIRPEDNIIEYNPNAIPTFGHAVVITGRRLINGVKCFAIENSWGDYYEFEDTQYLPEDFCKNRIFQAFYFLPEKNTPMPTYKFFTNLKVGFVNNDCIILQECLKSLGFLPSGMKTFPRFGEITKAGVIKFQKAYNLPTTGFFGEMSRKKMNELIITPNFQSKATLYLKSLWRN